MPLSYVEAVRAACKACKAAGAVLVVFHGEHGSGMVAALNSELVGPDDFKTVPGLLRWTADHMEQGERLGPHDDN